jgi:PAS domain S-box-containing protein
MKAKTWERARIEAERDMEWRSDLDGAIIESAADAMIFADRSGTIRRWNRAACALFGFAPEEALGQSLDLIIPDDLRAAHWRGFDAAMKSGALKLDGHPTLTRATHKAGHRLYVEMTFALIITDAVAEGAVAIARDVTGRVLREKAAARTTSSTKVGATPAPLA